MSTSNENEYVNEDDETVYLDSADHNAEVGGDSPAGTLILFFSN
jgi:hypothetical protein